MKRAATRLALNLRKIAAHLLNTAENQPDSPTVLSVYEVATSQFLYGSWPGAVQWNRGDLPVDADVQLHVSESYTAPNLGPPDAENKVNAAATYGFMAILSWSKSTQKPTFRAC